MEELKLYEAAAEQAGCLQEVEKWDEVIISLKKSGTKNIGIIGENNCGKTDLMNKLAGTEVRKPTTLSLNESPLKVIFQDGGEEDGYETVKVDNEELKKEGIAFYEIPINKAIDKEKREALPMLEKMDAAVYIISAIAPFTGSDMENMDILANKLPFVVYVSKTDMIGSDEEYQEITDYIKEEFSRRYDHMPCQIYDGRNEGTVSDLTVFLGELDQKELREFHIMRLEQQVKAGILAILNEQMDQLEEERRKKEEEKAAAEDTAREERLKWNEIRLTMMEKQQEAIDEVNRKVTKEKYRIEKKMLEMMGKAQNKKEWIKKDLKLALEDEMETAGNSLMELVKDMAEAHAAWLISQVNREFGKELSVEDMPYYKNVYQVKSGKYDREFNSRKALAAVGSGVIAGGAVLSGMPFLPTCIVAIPASVFMVACIKESKEEYQEYSESMKKFVIDCCGKNMEAFRKQINSNISRYYEKILEDIRSLSEGKGPSVDFDDIEKRKGSLQKIIDGLK